MDECALTTPKFLVKTASNTPDWAWDKMLDMARRHRSIAFVGEEPTARALKKWHGASDEDCRTMVLRGCYEFDLRDSVNRTGCGYVNILKPIETMLEECRAGNGTLNSQLSTPSNPNTSAASPLSRRAAAKLPSSSRSRLPRLIPPDA